MIIITLHTRRGSHSHFANGLSGFDSLAASAVSACCCSLAIKLSTMFI